MTPALVDSLLEEWRRCRDPQLAALIERAGALLPAPRVAGTPAAIAATLLNELHDVSTVQQHLPRLQRKHAAELLERAALQPPDPRWGPYLAGWLDTRPFISGRDVWQATLSLLAHTGDPRTLERLQRGVDSMPYETAAFLSDRHWTACTAAVEAIEERSTTLDLAPLLEQIEQAERRRVQQATELTELTTRVAVHRDRDSALVLADHLLQAGDVRGEFMLLQTLECPGRAELARMNQLQKAYGVSWLGDLAPVVLQRGLRFQLGMPHAVVVAFKNAAQFQDLLPSPTWTSVREVALHTKVSWDQRNAEHPLVPLLSRYPQIHTVSELDHPWTAMGVLFGREPRAFRAVRLQGVFDHWARDQPAAGSHPASIELLEIPHQASKAAIGWIRRHGLRVQTLHVRHLPSVANWKPRVAVDTEAAGLELRDQLAPHVEHVQVWYGAKHLGPVSQ